MSAHRLRPHSRPRVTIKDVAARAGVSKGAVSLAFNRKPGLAEATRDRIFAAARELGWAPNLTARSLSSQRVDVVGLAICRPARLLGLEPFYMEFISGVESVLTERSCSLLLRLVRIWRRRSGSRSRGGGGGRSVGRSWSTSARTIRGCPRCERLGMPVVAVGHPSLTGGLTSVWTDDATAVTEAVRYLAALGHRRIARVGGAASLGHTAIRTAAFDEAARGAGAGRGLAGGDRLLRRGGGPGDAVAADRPPRRTGRRRSCTTTTSWRWRGCPWRRRWG